MKRTILTLTMDYMKNTNSHYERYDAPIEETAEYLKQTFLEMSERRRKDYKDMHVITIWGKKPETKEEEKLIQEELKEGKILRIHDKFTNDTNDWYIASKPLKNCLSRINVVKNGKLVLNNKQ